MRLCSAPNVFGSPVGKEVGQPPQNPPPPGPPPTPPPPPHRRPVTASVFFHTYFFLGCYIFLSLILANITDNFRHVFSRNQFPVTDEHLTLLRGTWTTIHQGPHMPRWKLYALFEQLYLGCLPFGMHPILDKRLFNLALLEMDWIKHVREKELLIRQVWGGGGLPERREQGTRMEQMVDRAHGRQRQ